MRKINFFMGALLLSAALAGCQNQAAQTTTAAQTEAAAEAGSEGTEAESETEAVESEAGAGTEEAQSGDEATSEEPFGDTEAAEADQAESGETSAEDSAGGNGVLVAYFSYAENAELADDVDASSSASIQRWNDEITGNTGVVAHMIAEAAGADTFSIRTAEKYPSDYDGTIDIGQQERNANARPALAEGIDNLADYDTVFLGFPNWWGDMPMAMYTFLDEYDLGGKTVIMFCTSGGSGFSGAIRSVQGLEPEAEVVQGLSIGASSAMQAQEDVNEWVAGLEL